MTNTPPVPKRKHKATYATDKRNGGYLVRVVGPNATLFAGQDVPVTTRDDSEHKERLLRLVWSGTDLGTPDRPGTGQPCALYTFQSKPKEKKDVEF